MGLVLERVNILLGNTAAWRWGLKSQQDVSMILHCLQNVNGAVYMRLHMTCF